jgi:mono/diheme cytochrome c family protein
MKSKLLMAIAFIGILLFVAACGPSPEADAGSAGDEHVEDEHVEDDEHAHGPEEHMAAAHNVPEEAAAVPNPISATDDSIATGATVFTTNCAACHGAEGRGDGPAAVGLETKPADLNADHVQGLSDGALFYIISHGKADTPMPAWEEALEEGERWNVVNFLRTLVDEHDDGDHMEDEHMEGDEHAEDEHTEGDEHSEDAHEEGDEHTEDEHSD